jgi:hypothetical protein
MGGEGGRDASRFGEAYFLGAIGGVFAQVTNDEAMTNPCTYASDKTAFNLKNSLAICSGIALPTPHILAKKKKAASLHQLT